MSIMASLGLSVSPARAALEIGKSDIIETLGENGDVSTWKYGYELSYADVVKTFEDKGYSPTSGASSTYIPLSSGGKFFDDIFEASSNIRLTMYSRSSAWTDSQVWASGGTGESYFTYKFDFTNAGYEITSFTVKDILYAVNATTQTRSVTTQYSTDGVTWTDAGGNLTNILRTTTSITSGTFTGGTSSLITLDPGVSTLYYRVLFAPTGGPATSGDNTSWNRLNGNAGGNNSNFFEVNFSLTPASIPEPSIPEPATVTLLSGAIVSGLSLLLRLRLRSRS